jgi:hypothetical protein
MERARRAETAKADNTTIVTIAVLIGKCHDIHSMMADDKARVQKKPTIPVRFCAAFVMPTPENQSETYVTLYTAIEKKSPYRKPRKLSAGAKRMTMSV